MPEYLKVALLCVAVGATAGVTVSLLLPRQQPDWRDRYVNRRSWLILLVGLTLCTAMSAGHFVEGRPYLGGFFAAFASAAFFVLLILGFRFLSRERQ